MSTHLMATLSYQRAIIGGELGEGAAISTAMMPFLLAAIMVSWFGLQRRKWQQGETNELTPRARRPKPAVGRTRRGRHRGHELPGVAAAADGDALSAAVLILIVLLFPFYWMALTAIKPDEQLLDHGQLQSVLDLDADAQAHQQAAVRDATIRCGSGTRCTWRFAATDPVAVRQRAGGLCDRAAALSRCADGSAA